MSHRRRVVCLGIGLLLAGMAAAQTPAAKTEAELDAEATQADALYKQAQSLATLPMYEELHSARPKNPVYTERLAMAYIAKGSSTADPAESVAARNHARELFAEAQKQGDRSDLLSVMMEKLGGPESVPAKGAVVAAPGDPRAPGSPFSQAELLFSKGDLKGAIALYKKSWEENPRFYSAPLYAGDAQYKLGNFDDAGVWFERAIEINPDLETAHRYWADCLMKAGKPLEARKQYLDAFIADPYQKAPRLSLRAWADANKMRYIPPAISLPTPPTRDKDGHINITIALPQQDDGLSSVWMIYSMSAAVWQTEKFKKTYPKEKAYRHSLAEEMDAIQMLLAGIKEQKIPDSKLTPTLRSLIALDKDGMLECWILLDNPDNGTAQDYFAFRATHKELLRAYIEKYDLHPA